MPLASGLQVLSCGYTLVVLAMCHNCPFNFENNRISWAKIVSVLPNCQLGNFEPKKTRIFIFPKKRRRTIKRRIFFQSPSHLTLPSMYKKIFRLLIIVRIYRKTGIWYEILSYVYLDGSAFVMEEEAKPDTEATKNFFHLGFDLK